MKEGERINRRTYIHDPRLWIVMRGLTVGMGGGLCEWGQRGGNQDNYNNINNKI